MKFPVVARVTCWLYAIVASYLAHATFADTSADLHLSFSSGGVSQGADFEANPIRRVVNLLQKMVAKVEEEGKKEEQLYQRFNCYCLQSGGDLAKSIAESTAKVPQVQHDIEENEAEVVQLKQDLKAHQDDRVSAKNAMEAAVAQRQKEHGIFVETSKEYKGYLDALSRAIPAIDKGMSGGALLQAQSGSTGKALRKALSNCVSITEYDRHLVASFLAGSAAFENGYIPKSAEIVGILKAIEDDFSKSLDDVVKAEEEAVKIFEELMSAKKKQVQILTSAIEDKMQRTGELQVEVANMKGELTESEAALIADQKMAVELEASCKSKEGEWQERQRVRAEELVALHETIKILNDDDALDIFRKTLPGASLLQVHIERVMKVKQIRALIMRLPKATAQPVADLLALAISGKNVDFGKVVKMIEDMIALLKQEQVDDDSKKENCEKQLHSVEGKIKDSERHIGDLEMSIEEKAESIKSLVAELKELAKGIELLDKSVAEETEIRKEEHEEYVTVMKDNNAAKELLNFAKNRLNKFYSPGLYKEALNTNSSVKERSRDVSGAANSQTDAGKSFAQFFAHRVTEHGFSAPETWSTYERRDQETKGVVAMIDRLIKDLDREITDAEHEETNSQKAYEELTRDAAAKRAGDVRSIAAKQKAKADFEEGRVTDDKEKQAISKELQAILMYKMELHQECDWLAQNYLLRKGARNEEMQSLNDAKAILLGADFSLVQKPTVGVAISRHLRG